MSGNTSAEGRGEEPDSRSARTRAAVVGSFNELVLDRRYDRIRVQEIVAGAKVGRSTFYEHYRGKDDVLLQSMAFMLDALADAACGEVDARPLEHLVAHFGEQRELGRYLLAGPPARHLFPRLVHELAARIEARLAARAGASAAPALPRRSIAVQAAEAQLGLLRAWLSGHAPGSAREIAAGLGRGPRASIAALLGD